MSGRVGDLSAKQAEALKKFRENVQDVIQPHHDDHYLLRWLRARSFDLKKSEKMLRENLEWRARVGADTILETYTPPEVLVKYYPGGLTGFDKQGRPVWIDTIGRADVKGLFRSSRKADLVRFKVQQVEEIFVLFQEESRKLGRRVDQIGLIFDMEGFGMKHLWKPAVDVFTEILAMYESRYPETLSYCIVINAPRIFPIAYNLVKIFLSEDTKRKIIIAGSNWKTVVLDKIDTDQLPVHWGGTQTDPDGDIYCKSKICMAGEVPKKYYANQMDAIDTSAFTTETVGRGSSLQIDVNVEDPGKVIRWQFLTEGNDIGFGVFYREMEGRQRAGAMQEVYASERVNSHIVPEQDSLVCERSGTYVVRFDNTYSWLRSKTVSYQIEVLEADKGEDLPNSVGISESDDDL